MEKYTHEQRVKILGVCKDLKDGSIILSIAESKVESISSNYPLNTLLRETSRLKSYLNGKSTYGYGYATTWAKALLELTANDPNVVFALNAQQQAYQEKDGKINQKLQSLLNEVE